MHEITLETKQTPVKSYQSIFSNFFSGVLPICQTNDERKGRINECQNGDGMAELRILPANTSWDGSL